METRSQKKPWQGKRRSLSEGMSTKEEDTDGQGDDDIFYQKHLPQTTTHTDQSSNKVVVESREIQVEFDKLLDKCDQAI